MEVLTACVLHVVCIKRKRQTAPVNASINTILVNRGLIPAPIAVAKSSANGLEGTRFASRYRLQPRAGIKRPNG